jgi:hypothetical protein
MEMNTADLAADPEASPEELYWGEDDDDDSSGSDYMSNDSDSDWVPSDI